MSDFRNKDGGIGGVCMPAFVLHYTNRLLSLLIFICRDSLKILHDISNVLILRLYRSSGEDKSVLENFIVKITKGTFELFLLHERGALRTFCWCCVLQ
jgi:hypothetical protein